MNLTKVSYAMINGAVFNVLDFGADPTGTNDSYSAIEAALSAAATGGTIYFPIGNYLCSSIITIDSGISLIGESRGNSVQNGISTITFTSTTNYNSGIQCVIGSGYQHIADLLLVGPGTSVDSSGLHIIKCAFSTFERLFVKSFKYGIIDDAVQNVSYKDIVINTCNYGVYWTDGAAQDYHTVCRYENIYVSGVTDIGFRVHGGSSVDSLCKENTFVNCAADGANIGWDILYCLDSAFNNCYTELCGSNGFAIQNSESLEFNGIYIGMANNSATSSYVPLYSTNNQGCLWNLVTYNASVGSPTWHFQFLGGSGYFNSLTNYKREDGALTTIQNNNTLINLSSNSSLPQVQQILANNFFAVNQNVATTVGSSGGASALPATPVKYWVVNIEGNPYKIPLYNI